MESGEASAAATTEPAEGDVSTTVKLLPQVPESSFEEQALDYPDLRTVDMELEEDAPIALREGEKRKSLLSEFDDYNAEVKPNGHAAVPEPTPAPDSTNQSTQETAQAFSPSSEMTLSELMQSEPTPTKRSLRKKTRKRVYQEEESELELPSEEESLFPRVNNRYYSDDDYVPGSERKSKSKKSHDDYDEQDDEEEDEEIVEEFPKRRRKRKKAGEQKTPAKSEKKPPLKRNRGRAKIQLESGASEPGAAETALADSTEVPPADESKNVASVSVEPVTLDSDSDIENCLSVSKIKVENKAKVKLFTEDSKESVSTAPDSKQKKPNGPTSEMGKAFENFLVTNSELKVKKLSKKAQESTTQLEIPTIEPPELIKLIDSWTQTEVASVKASGVQTTSPYAMRMSKNLPLSSEQSDNACEFMKNVLTMTTELGTLMCQKSKEFIEKKINADYMKDTTKVAFCKEKTSLLFKLAKDNLTKIEDLLEKNYEEYINSNNLEAAVEKDKTLKANECDADSDCEIVEVKEEPKKKFNANTVFLNKELSIKIAKKPATVNAKTTPSGRQLKVPGRGGHAVWINKSIMVKKVKPSQSFLAQDGRFKKPPDNKNNKIEEVVHSFFENYNKINACCQPFLSTEWLVPTKDHKVACNYFFVEAPPQCSKNMTTGSGSEDDGFFDSPSSNETVPVLNNQYDVVGAPDVNPLPIEQQQSSHEPEPLVTICLQYLHNLLYKPRIGESLKAAIYDTSDTDNLMKPTKTENSLKVCVGNLEKNINPKADSETILQKNIENRLHRDSIPSELSRLCVNEITTPEKLSIICLKSICKYSKILMTLNGLMKTQSHVNKTTILQEPKLHQLSLKMICYRWMIAMLYKNKADRNVLAPVGTINLKAGVPHDLKSHNVTRKKSEIDQFTIDIENRPNDCITEKVKPLKIMCTEVVNFMLNFTGHVPAVPAIMDVRQLNGFNESEEDSMGDECDFPDEDYQQYDYAPQNNWFGKIHVSELKTYVRNSPSQPEEVEQNIAEGITLKLEPIDDEENQPEFSEPAIVKMEKTTLNNDSMVAVPTDAIIPKTESTGNIEDNDDAENELLNHLTEHFLDNQFEVIMRRNKIRPQGSPLAETPYDAIFSQSQDRVRREFEPDSDPENDSLDLLTVQSFRDVNVQPASKAKGTLLESSSDDESKNNSEASVKRKRGRPRKNKNENKNKSGTVLPPATVLEAPPPMPLPKSKDKISNEIEILTRRMRERIRTEEKEKQKESSTDSENEILYSFNSKESPELVGSLNTPELPPVPEKKSLKKKEHLLKPTRNLRSSKQDVASNKSDLVEGVAKEPRESPDFPGFAPADESQAASYRSYLKYIHDKGIEDLHSNIPNLSTNSSVHDTADACGPKASTFNDVDDVDCAYEDGDYFSQEFDTSCIDELSGSKETNKSRISDSTDKKQSSANRDKIIDDMDEEGFSMLTPQVAIVVDENKKVDLGFTEIPANLKERKKMSKETLVETPKNVVTDVPDVIEPVLNKEAWAISDPGVTPMERHTTGIEMTQTVKSELNAWTMRDGWKCYKISDNDEKLYQLCYVPMDKLPETFVQTYFEFVQLAETRIEKDPEIDRLTNLKSLHRASTKEDGLIKRTPRDSSKQSEAGDGIHEASDHDDHNYLELEPSDDEHVPPENAENLPCLGVQKLEVKTENTLAKNSLMGDGGSDSEASGDEDPAPDVKPDVKFMTGPKSKRTLVVNKVAAHPDSLVLTADKMMKKDLDLLHAPVVMANGNVLPNKMNIKSAEKPHKSDRGSREKHKSDVDSDASSEEEKQWITTKEKLLRRLQKKHRDQLKIDDDKRARIVSTYIEKKADETTTSYSQTVLQQRRRRKPKMKTRKQKEKELRLLSMELQKELVKNGEMIDMNLPIHGRAGAGGTVHRGGRRNIRKVIDKKSLARSTVIANMEEFERKKRLGLMHVQLCKHLGCESTVKAIVIDKQLCLEYDFAANQPSVSVHEAFTNVMKAHQCEGLKFMWDASFETLRRMDEGHPGGGCILAHCMGLGKTLQVLALLHTVMTHRNVGVKRVLVCCPLSTVLNWVDEIHKWMGPVKEKIKVFELSKLKKTYERAYQLEDWYNGGGIFIIGYELFRTLTTLHPYLDDIRPTIINKINSALLDPGPDIVICDEGHLLKNDCSGLAVAMSRVKTSRRIVLTGTPMQNNLREYYCMVNFVKPNLLGTYSEFSNRFENPIMNGQHRDSSEADIRLMKARSHILHKVLEGCLQRQEASVLYPYLPKKCEYTVFISLSKCQSDLYKHYLEHLSRQSRQSILKDFHILQKIWTHPQVLHNFQLKSRDDVAKDDIKMEDDLGKEELGSEEMRAAGAGGEVWWTQHLDGGRMLDALEASNKFQVVFRILDECVRVGDKLLIFSTSLLTMDSLEYFLKTIKQWQLGHDYYRLDGSVPPEVRQKWCREFNADNNINTRLFLISTRAGCLGLNMTAANRVIILDTSWNPAHDIQSIFRVYRFGQKKDCYIYRLVSMGTMEQKIYERSVTKQAVACRVVDEQQIDRHYNMAELTALYSFEESDGSIPPLVTAGDALLLGVARTLPAVRAVHEHDSLLRDSCEQQLPEHERAAAWDQFQREQAHTQVQPKEVKRKKKMQPPSSQPEMYPTLAGAQQPCPMPPNAQINIPMSSIAQMPTSTNPEMRIPIQNTELIAQLSSSPRKRTSRRLRKRMESGSSTDSASESVGLDDGAAHADLDVGAAETCLDDGAAHTDSDDEDKQSLASLLASRPPVTTPPIGVAPPPPVKLPPIESPQVVETKKLNLMNAAVVRVYSGPPKQPLRKDDLIVLSDTEEPSTSAPPKVKARKKQVSKNSPTKHVLVKVPKSKVPEDEPTKEKVPLHPSLLSNPYFLKIVAHTYRSWNPNLEDEAAVAAAEFSAQNTLNKGREILSGTLYEIAVKTLGVQTMKVLWHNYQSDKEKTTPLLPDEVAAPAPDTRKVAPLRLKVPPAAEPKRTTLKLREPASLLRQQPPPQPPPPPAPTPPPPQPPKPVSLHIGAHPSATMHMGLMQSTTVDLCDDNDGEEESILPDDDVPRIGTASPPPPPPPPRLTPIAAPAAPKPVRTARKKTTSKFSLKLPEPEPSGYDIITVPHSTIVPGSTSQASAVTRVTFIRKLRPVPTHIIDSSNQIVPISSAPSVTAPPAPPPPLAPPQLPMDTPICLDSDEEDVPAIAPPPPQPPTQPAIATPRPNILNPTLPQSNITEPLMSQTMQPTIKNHQPPRQSINAQQINLNQFLERLQPNETLQSVLQKGTQMGNIILVPASAFQGQSSMLSAAPIIGMMPQQFGIPTVPVSQIHEPTMAVPTTVVLSSVASPPTAPPSAAPPSATPPSAVPLATPPASAADSSVSSPATPAFPAQEKRGRGRPRKYYPNIGDRMVFTSSGQAWQTPAAQGSPSAQPPLAPAPAREQVLNVDIPIRPEKPPSVPQEPTSTTGDDPTVDLTDEPRARSSSSSSSSRSSSSSSSSSRDSSPDTPLSLFKNVVKIQANNYIAPSTSKSNLKAQDATITFTDLDDLELSEPGPSSRKPGPSSSKPGPSSSKAGPSASKPAQPRSKLKALEDMITFTDLDDLELPSSKPGPSSSTPAHPSKHWPIAAESGPSTAKAGQSTKKTATNISSANKKPSLAAKKANANTASWQIPKFLSASKKPSTPSKAASMQAQNSASKNNAPQVLVDSVDLTDTPAPEPSSKGLKHKMTGKEHVLGTVDLTDEPVAKKAVAAPKSTNLSRSSGVTSTQGAKNITLTKTGAITFTSKAVPDSAKAKVVSVTSVKSEVKIAPKGTEKRKAPAAAAPAKKSKPARPLPLSLEDFSIDDITDDIIELE